MWQHACGVVALVSALAQQAHSAAVARPLTTAAARQTAHRLVPGADAAIHRYLVADLTQRSMFWEEAVQKALISPVQALQEASGQEAEGLRGAAQGRQGA